MVFVGNFERTFVVLSANLSHEKKLRDYMNDPLKHDNTGILANSAGMLTRMWDIYFGRINNLMKQIENFRKLLAECEAKNGK